jgi:chloramphenicol-sensitive protein RarD
VNPSPALTGLLLGLAAYSMWGLFPLFFHQLRHVASTEVLSHRVIWSFLFCLLVLLIKGWWARLVLAVRSPQLVKGLLISSLLVSSNWLIYIWAVAQARVLESSLGYFITPLVSVFLARVVLHERMNRWQWLAVFLASLGVGWLLVRLGYLPWVSLGLAFTFGLYGLARKQIAVDTLTGLTLETALLAPLALAYALYLAYTGQPAFLHIDLSTDLLLLTCGIVTATPLLLFAAAARRLSLTVMGFMMYVNPSLQFLIALLVLQEPLADDMLIAFAFIWLALLIFSVGALPRAARQRSTEV